MNYHDPLGLDYHHERGTMAPNPKILRGVDMRGKVILKRKDDRDRLEEYKSSRRMIMREQKGK